jgi:hypothetical protein
MGGGNDYEDKLKYLLSIDGEHLLSLTKKLRTQKEVDGGDDTGESEL